MHQIKVVWIQVIGNTCTVQYVFKELYAKWHYICATLEVLGTIKHWRYVVDTWIYNIIDHSACTYKCKIYHQLWLIRWKFAKKRGDILTDFPSKKGKRVEFYCCQLKSAVNWLKSTENNFQLYCIGELIKKCTIIGMCCSIHYFFEYWFKKV